MFNLGLPELLVIGVAALLVFGPRRLPELARGLGKGIRDFKKALEGGDDNDKKDSLPTPEPKDEDEQTQDSEKPPSQPSKP